MSENTDLITVLTCAPGLRMAKLVRPWGIVPYDSAKFFTVKTVLVSGLDALAEQLHALLGQTRCCIVRGQLIDGMQASGIRRLLHADLETGDAPTFQDRAHFWVALDVDWIERPEQISAADLKRCANLVRATLPPGFRQCRCIVQATASHGVKPGIRLRLFFWLDHPVTGVFLARWFSDTDVDRSIFNAIQPIYTAAPVFVAGVVDPLPQRQVMLPGTPVVSVPPELKTWQRRAPCRVPERGTVGSLRYYALGALRRAVERVASASEGSRNVTLNLEAFSLCRFVTEGALTGVEIADALGIAAHYAGLPVSEARATIASALRARSAT